MNSIQNTCTLIISRRLIPVIRTETAEQALQVAEVLVEAGMGTLEVTFTVPGALGCLATLARRYGDAVLIGAGTVLDAANARKATAAGARFVVSPALRPEVITAAHEGGAAALAGALTPTEAVAAWELGADFVKIFPCDAVGGPAYIKALRGPFPDIPLVPTGGVTEATAEAFLKAGAAALGVGGGLLPNAEVRAGAWDKIRTRAQRLIEVVEAATPAPSVAR